MFVHCCNNETGGFPAKYKLKEFFKADQQIDCEQSNQQTKFPNAKQSLQKTVSDIITVSFSMAFSGK